MSYFGVKHSHLRAFLGQKRDFRTFVGQKNVILGHFGSKKANFDLF